MEKFVSVIIPNYNGSATIEKCLGAAFSSDYSRYEVIVVDDCSTDHSTEIIGKFPCTLVRLDRRSGAAKARNMGALQSSGEILFFTDADCILEADTLSRAVRSVKGREGSVIGGTYTRIPYDDTFFSAFQSIFVHYSETKNTVPDYIATHAMAITPELFRKTGGFSEDFLPILEDVEFSHRLRRSGSGLIMDPLILVRHIFNFTLMKSLGNAFRKSMFWTEYSLKNRDVFADSGTASRELKVNVASFFLSALLLFLAYLSGKVLFLFLFPFITSLNLFSSRGLIRAFHQTKGFHFAVAATMFYTMLYPMAVGAGAFAGVWRYFRAGDGR
ncbi:MAG: glycosyltransferase [Nitrospirae bacterium]|nr:glycosyltransferase [Nitrospirota bacterium]MCL5422138.1 glycosyltransferase [Nitrospirota bacterium]